MDAEDIDPRNLRVVDHFIRRTGSSGPASVNHLAQDHPSRSGPTRVLLCRRTTEACTFFVTAIEAHNHPVPCKSR